MQAVPELVSSLSHGRLSTAEEHSSEPAANSGSPSSTAGAAAQDSPWEARSPGDSPRSRITARMDSLTGERRQARTLPLPTLQAACMRGATGCCLSPVLA